MKFLKLSIFILAFYAVLNVSAVLASSTITFNGETVNAVSETTLWSSTAYTPPDPVYLYCGQLSSWSSISSGGFYMCVLDNNATSGTPEMALFYMQYGNRVTQANPWQVGATFYKEIITPPTPPPTITAGTFFPKNETGQNTANDLLASVGTATGTTTKSFSPIIVIVSGIILAFFFIKSLINLIYEIKQDRTKNTTK